MWWKLRRDYESLPQSEGKPKPTNSQWAQWFTQRLPRLTVVLGATNAITLTAFLLKSNSIPSREALVEQCTRELSTFCKFADGEVLVSTYLLTICISTSL